MVRVSVNRGYMITLSEKDMEALAFIADRYEYGAALTTAKATYQSVKTALAQADFPDDIDLEALRGLDGQV